MPSFSTPLSGLNANSQDLSVIANNLANLNTVGYKAAVANFQDLFYQQIGTNGAGDPVQVGVGTTVSSIAGQFTQGSIESTGVPTDVAIQGGGFLTLVKNGLQEYTRAGLTRWLREVISWTTAWLAGAPQSSSRCAALST